MLTERLSVEGCAAISFILSFLRQKTKASSARNATTEEPRTIPTIGPTFSLLSPFPPFGLVGSLLEPCGACEAGGEWFLCLPGGGGVYGGGGGAGPLLNEFPSYLLKEKVNPRYYVIRA